MSIVVDASVALKWFLAERDSDAADRVRLKEDLVAPDLLVAEVGNGLWRHARIGRVEWSLAELAVVALLRDFDRLEASAGLTRDALRISRTLDHPTYDCFYLALVERERIPLVTADERLVAKVAGTGWEARVQPLSAY